MQNGHKGGMEVLQRACPHCQINRQTREPNALIAMQDTVLPLIVSHHHMPTSQHFRIVRYYMYMSTDTSLFLVPGSRRWGRNISIFQSVSTVPPPFNKHVFILKGRGFTFASSRRRRQLSWHWRHIALSFSPSRVWPSLTRLRAIRSTWSRRLLPKLSRQRTCSVPGFC